jgi:hypothetical protein
MAPNTTWTVRLTVKVTALAGTVITESGTVTEDTVDPNPANKTATVSTTVRERSMQWNESAIEWGQGIVLVLNFCRTPQLTVLLINDWLEAAATHIALQAGHSDRCFNSSRSASFAHRKSSSGRPIPGSLTAFREADRNSSAGEFPIGQNRAS